MCYHVCANFPEAYLSRVRHVFKKKKKTTQCSWLLNYMLGCCQTNKSRRRLRLCRSLLCDSRARIKRIYWDSVNPPFVVMTTEQVKGINHIIWQCKIAWICSFLSDDVMIVPCKTTAWDKPYTIIRNDRIVCHLLYSNYNKTAFWLPEYGACSGTLILKWTVSP